MSDNKLILSKPILNVSGYFTSDAKGKRIHAVAAALDLIAARVSPECHIDQLKMEMERLSTYADQIQAAIDKK